MCASNIATPNTICASNIATPNTSITRNTTQYHKKNLQETLFIKMKAECYNTSLEKY